MRKSANLCENDCLPIQDDGWKETFAYCDSKDKSRMVWTPQRLSTVIDSYFTWTNGSPLPKDMKVSSKVGGKNGDTDEEARRMVRRPYNILTFIARAGIDNWEKFKTRYCNESTEDGQEFIRLCAKLENYIYGNLQGWATPRWPSTVTTALQTHSDLGAAWKVPGQVSLAQPCPGGGSVWYR